MNRERLVIGVVVAAVGVLLARTADQITGSSPQSTLVVYVLGVLIALAGLAVVASAMRVTQRKVVQCSKCWTLNDVARETCARCSRPLPAEGAESDSSEPAHPKNASLSTTESLCDK